MRAAAQAKAGARAAVDRASLIDSTGHQAGHSKHLGFLGASKQSLLFAIPTLEPDSVGLKCGLCALKIPLLGRHD